MAYQQPSMWRLLAIFSVILVVPIHCQTYNSSSVIGCWTVYYNSNAPGSVKQSSISTLYDCSNQCYQTDGCAGIDWNPNVQATDRCWFTFGSNTVNPNGYAGVTHYTWNATCGQCWTVYPNSNTPGSIGYSNISTLADCTKQCDNLNWCVGYDFNPSVANGCYLTNKSASAINVNGYPGVTHYQWTCLTYAVLTDSPLTLTSFKPTPTLPQSSTTSSSTTSTSPTTTTTQQQVTAMPPTGCTWVPYQNSNTAGGTLQSSVTTLFLCTYQCQTQSSTCPYGVDWTGSQCYFATTSNINIGSANGVTHYSLICPTNPPTSTMTTTTTTTTTQQPGTASPPTGCVWAMFANSYTSNGIAQSGVSSLFQCTAQCGAAQTTNCQYGIDWAPNNPAGNQCYFSTSSTVQPGSPSVTHYGLVCQTISPPTSTTTTTSTTSTTTTTTPPTTPVMTASPPPGCSWAISSNSFSSGGSVQPAAMSLAQCQTMCMAQASACSYGFDWNPSNAPGNQCFLSTTSNVNVNGYPGVNHYSVSCPTTTTGATTPTSTTTTTTTTPPTTTVTVPPPSGCSWVPTSNSNSPGGSANNAMNLGQCQSNCINQPSGCQYGFDWNQSNPPGNQCFLSNYPTVNVGTFPGVVHYQLVCATTATTPTTTTTTTTTPTTTTTTTPTTTTTTPTTTTSPNVPGCNWTPYNNSNTLGGVQQSGLNSQMACQLGCYNAANGACKGYEWAANNSPGSQCYFFPTNAPPTNMGTAAGVNHYTWDCSTVTGPPTTSTTSNGCNWNPYPNMNIFGGAQQTSATSQGQCQTLCQSTSGCLAYEWTSSNLCYTFTSAAVPTNPAPGVTHYIYTCQTTTTSTTTTTTMPPTVVGCTWMLYQNLNIFGGVQQSGISSQQQCQSTCQMNIGSCSAYEWAGGNSPGSQCFFFASNTVPTNTANGVNHYVWTCTTPTTISTSTTTTTPATTTTTATQPPTVPGCTWMPYINSNTFGGVQQSSITSDAQCRSMCQSSGPASCNAYEWASNNGAGSQCYFFLSGAPPTNMGQAPGVNHYVLTCTTSTTTTMTTIPNNNPGCSNWMAYNNMNIFGGSLQAGVSSLSQCQNMCMAPGCLAIEWTSDNKCFFFTSATVPTNTALGVNHYICATASATTTMPNNPNPACTWTPYFGMNIFGGSQQSGVSSLTQCQNTCLQTASTSGCKAIEWTTTSMCYFFTSSSAPTNPATGVNHYVVNCAAAAPSTAIQAVPTSTAAVAVGGGTCSFTMYSGKSMPNGLLTPYNNYNDCLQNCTPANSCRAYQWRSSFLECKYFANSGQPTQDDPPTTYFTC